MVSLLLLLLQAVSSFSPVYEVAAAEELLPEIDDAEEKLQHAFNALNRANEAGASQIEISELAMRLNEALTLLRQAKAAQVSGNTSLAAEYVSQSLATSDGVHEEAEHMHKTTSEALFSSRVVLFASTAVVGLIAAVVFYYAYRARQRPSTEKILRMGISRK